jgi:glycosyltransferase involved in cell wall biosynthesis
MGAIHVTPLKVVFVGSQDSGSGASRALHRIYRAIAENRADTVDISMRVVHKSYDDDHIIGGKPVRNWREYAEYFLRTRFRKYFPRPPFESDNKLLHSQALYHSGLGRELNEMRADVIMLGWLGNSTLSIPEIGRLKAPVVWRLSDMWMFSGAEHYTAHQRYAVGYSKKSRPITESGPDIDRETFLRKRRHWRKARHVITPSHWMAEQVRKSTLTQDWPVQVIPNPIDTDYWAPVNRTNARARFGFSEESVVVLFGTGGGTKHHHKGGDLLLSSLGHLKKQLDALGDTREVVCAIFGEERPDEAIGGVKVTFLGRLDDEGLKAAYSAADVMVVPSRLDNLPSTAVEAQSCATAVVAFRVGGLPDIVDNGITGRIVEPFDVEELAEAITWVVTDPNRCEQLGHAARDRAERLWAPEIIAQQYLDVLALAAGEAPSSR